MRETKGANRVVFVTLREGGGSGASEKAVEDDWDSLYCCAMSRMCVYILASHKRGALYIGVTNDLVRRAAEHQSGAVEGFTRRYGIHHLVCFEAHDSAEAAITREKRLKTWLRAWKIRLIEESNPEWRDLAAELD